VTVSALVAGMPATVAPTARLAPDPGTIDLPEGRSRSRSRSRGRSSNNKNNSNNTSSRSSFTRPQNQQELRTHTYSTSPREPRCKQHHAASSTLATSPHQNPMLAKLLPGQWQQLAATPHPHHPLLQH